MNRRNTWPRVLGVAAMLVLMTGAPRAESDSTAIHNPSRPAKVATPAIRSISRISNQIELAVAPLPDTAGYEVLFRTNLLLGDWESIGLLNPAETSWSTNLAAPMAFFSVVPAQESTQTRLSATSALPANPPLATAKSAAGATATAQPALRNPPKFFARLEAREAWRGRAQATVPNNQKFTPGLLITPNIDGTNPDPLEARLIFKAIPAGYGLKRYIRFSPKGLVEFRSTAETTAPWRPTQWEAQIPGRVDRDWPRDVAMANPQAWSNHTSVRIDYIVRDANRNIVARDKVRLLAPVILPIGDSTTFGFMRSRENTHLTPPTPGYRGWNKSTDWSNYPDDQQWQSLPAPWNVANNKKLSKFQGYRGYLADKLPGFLWQGEDVKGHGPRHMGYNGAHINHITQRAPSSVLRTGHCYAIVIYFTGLNDAVNGKTSSTIYSAWQNGLQNLLTARRNRGKTLVVGATLPKVASYYTLYNPTNQTYLTGFNRRVRIHNLSAPHTRYRCADLEGIRHGSADGMQDDGLHFFEPGNRLMADTIAAAIWDGLR